MSAVILFARRERAATQRQLTTAIARCRAMGGEPILDYAYNSDDFFLTGCKLR